MSRKNSEETPSPAVPDSNDPLGTEAATAEAKRESVNADAADEAEVIHQEARDEAQEIGVNDGAQSDNADVQELVEAKAVAAIEDVQGVDVHTSDENDLSSAELLLLAQRLDSVSVNPAEHDRLMAKRAERLLEEARAGESY